MQVNITHKRGDTTYEMEIVNANDIAYFCTVIQKAEDYLANPEKAEKRFTEILADIDAEKAAKPITV